MFITDPVEIEKRSMQIIAPYLKDLNLSDDELKICSRIIHASGDVDYASLIRIHHDAIDALKAALLRGANIFTDVEMVRRGISIRAFSQFGGEIFCKISDRDVKALAKEQGITRAMAAMRLFSKRLNGQIVVIGNAPTALFEVLRLVKEENIRPAVIVATPVGFVGAADSKKLLSAQIVPYITVEGTKGGSSVAVAAVNACLYMLVNSNLLSEK